MGGIRCICSSRSYCSDRSLLILGVHDLSWGYWGREQLLYQCFYLCRAEDEEATFRMEHIMNENSQPRYPVGDSPQTVLRGPAGGRGQCPAGGLWVGLSSADSGSGRGIEVGESWHGQLEIQLSPVNLRGSWGRKGGLEGEAGATCTQNCREHSYLPCDDAWFPVHHDRHSIVSEIRQGGRALNCSEPLTAQSSCNHLYLLLVTEGTFLS